MLLLFLSPSFLILPAPKKHTLALTYVLFLSHEVRDEGYEIEHGGKLSTVLFAPKLLWLSN